MARTIAMAVAVVLALTVSGCSNTDASAECFAGGSEFTLKLKNPSKDLSLPAIPAGGDNYSYATDSAMVSVPDACAEKFRDKITKSTRIPTRKPGETITYFFIGDLEDTWTTLEAMATSSCACGLVIEAHGSGGPGYTAVQLAGLFATMGFVQVIPNSMAMPDNLKLKGKLPAKEIGEMGVSNYCGALSPMGGKCSTFSDDKPYCYSTKVENVLNDPDNYRKYVEGVYQIRKRELDYFMTSRATLLDAFKNTILAGNSEGGMLASRYHHANLDKHLKGRIISAWSCDFNYFTSCAEHVKVCGDECNKDVPQLNLMGTADKFFGRVSGSISSKVADASNGYGGPITGNCQQQYVSQKFTKATVVEFEGAGHGPNYYDDNLYRSVIADFLKGGGQNQDTWKSLKGCTLVNGVYSCKPVEPETCTSIAKVYMVNPNATFNVTATYKCQSAGKNTKFEFLA